MREIDSNFGETDALYPPLPTAHEGDFEIREVNPILPPAVSNEMEVNEPIQTSEETNTKVVKVLSIDFDYIMFPCIRLYNDMCGGGESGKVVWDAIEHVRGIKEFLTFDRNAYKMISTLVIKNVLDEAIFEPIQEHQELVDILKKYYYDESKEEFTHKFDLLNIDFHHDCGYNPDTIADAISFDEYSCADWITYLNAKEVIEGPVKWLKAPMSDLPDPNNEELKVEIKTMAADKEDIMNEKYDIVVFCLSPQWVPHDFRHLYDIIVDTVNLILNSGRLLPV